MIDVIIIGGGASGLMCGVFAGKKFNNVIIIEKDLKVGKKILASGNGRCNLSNLVFNTDSYNVDVTKFFNKINAEKTIKIFNELGLEVFADNENRIYPITNMSNSVLDVLMLQLEKNNVKINTQEEVLSVQQIDNGYKVFTNKDCYLTKNVVVSCGGECALNKIAKPLNIKYKEFTNSLCGLKFNENIQELNGIRIHNAEVTLNINGLIKKEVGEIIFKKDGISGICIFNLSAFLSRCNNENAELTINLFPKLTKQELTNKLELRKLNLKNISIYDFFVGLLHKNIANEILKRLNINRNKNVELLKKCEWDNIVKCLQNLNFKVVGKYDNEQVHNGGILLEELTDALESKKYKNLYFCGEVVNVDGLCGGYNLQWAWTSGLIIANNLYEK